MMCRGEHEADANGIDAARHLFGREVEIDARGFEQVGTATLAGHRPVAMLGHLAAGRCHHERRRGGNIEDVHAVATGAAGIDQALGIEVDRLGQLAHHLHRADDLVDGFALHAHPHQERADLRIGALPGHDLAHHRFHFLGGQIQLTDDPVQGLLDIH